MADPTILLSPEPGAWRAALAARRALSPPALRFRSQLGLPTDRPVIMSGHQAAIWHCGILAKWLALAHAGKAFGAGTGWVVVDHDSEDFTTIRVPVKIPGPGGEHIEARPWRIASEEIGALLKSDQPPAALPPFPARAAPGPAELGARDFGTPGLGAGLERIARALASAGGASNGARSAAEQLTGATVELTKALVPPPVLCYGSRLAQTELFAELVERMRSSPAACAEAYNRAAGRHPRSGIAPLAKAPAEGGERFELPLWHIPGSAPGKGGIRRRVWSDSLASIPTHELAPRALMLTALLRLAGCDLFIHGTGGAGTDGASGYDSVTNEWIRDWLSAELAPTATASATMLLPLADRPVPSPEEVAAARWRAHHARHDAASLGDEVEAVKRAALAGIAATGNRVERREHFRRLHEALGAARPAAAGKLARLDREADELAAKAVAGAVLVDRTWAFPLHEPGALAGLSERIRAAVSAGAAGTGPA